MFSVDKVLPKSVNKGEFSGMYVSERPHDSDVIMGAMASQITSLTLVYSTVYSGADKKQHKSTASLAFVRGIHRWPVDSPHKWPIARKMFPFNDVIMQRFSDYCKFHIPENLRNRHFYDDFKHFINSLATQYCLLTAMFAPNHQVLNFTDKSHNTNTFFSWLKMCTAPNFAPLNYLALFEDVSANLQTQSAINT